MTDMPPAGTNPFAALDAVAQAELVASGEVTASELVQAAIDAVERIDPEVNAVIHRRFDEALAEASGDRLPDGPLRGVPMVLKDLDGFAAGQPYHAGMRALADAGFTAPTDCLLTERFRHAGLVVIGRTNVPELGLVPSTEPQHYGPTRNPWDTDRSAGGSSGGSAAAVASGMVPVGHAGDGGGSIRIPASVCALVGLKPSRGRITHGPEVGEAWSGLVARGVVTRTVRDTAAILDAVAGPAPGDPSPLPLAGAAYLDAAAAGAAGRVGALQVGVTTHGPDPSVTTDPRVAAVVEDAAVLLGELGHRVDHAQPQPWADASAHAGLTGDFVNALGVWTAAEVERLSNLAGVTVDASGTEAGTWALVELGRMVTGLQFHQALEGLASYTRGMASWWEDTGLDVLVTPVVPELPWELGQFASSADNPMAGVLRSAALVPFMAPFNVTGQPAMSVPLGWCDGLPVGVQLVGRRGAEDVLIALAAQLEVARPWQDRHPGVFAGA
jgi:amidase